MAAADHEIIPAPRNAANGSKEQNSVALEPEIKDGKFHINLQDNGGLTDNKFAFTPHQLHQLIIAKSLVVLDTFGGLQGLISGLRTDKAAGLSADEDLLDGRVTVEDALSSAKNTNPRDVTTIKPLAQATSEPTESNSEVGFSDRRRIFGENRLPRRKQKSFLALAWIAFNDKLLFLLTLSATCSLAIGIYQSVRQEERGSNIGWVDGVTVVIAILMIVFASAATDWQKNHKFQKLNERKEQRDVTVVRSGRPQRVSVYGVMVGDIMLLEAGDVIPVDGILVEASGVQIDESTVSGESELVHKSAPINRGPRPSSVDPYIHSGTTVVGGVGKYLVLSVGANSAYGRLLMSLRNDVEETPLQQRLGRLAKQLITFGAIAGLVFFLIQFIRFLVGLKTFEGGPAAKGEAFLKLFILTITVVVISVPEGLSLEVTLALAFATTRMLRDNNLVRLIRSCEIMGNATCICSDKTGTLTQNRMTVVVGRVGSSASFTDMESNESATPSSQDTKQGDQGLPAASMGSIEFVQKLGADMKALLKDSVALNSTAFEGNEADDSRFLGSSTEVALLNFGKTHLGMGPLVEERANAAVIELLPFDSAKKWMAVLLKLDTGRYRLLVKGAAEIILDRCNEIVHDPFTGKETTPLTSAIRDELRSSIREYAKSMLRPITVAYVDFGVGERTETPEDPESLNFDAISHDLTFLGVFGIRDPLRSEVIESVRQCQEAGVFVRMVTGDNFMTAKAIATECGIYTAGGIVMDGPTFRQLTPAQLDLVVPRLQVLARSSPNDKLRLVTHLKGWKETVAVTGDGTNDALALKAADVGFAMGKAGTEVAKEASSIILMDDNFASIVKALSWGRTVNDATKKFLQVCQYQDRT
jgi:P-type Ca2+ transporter type 2C